MVDDRQSRSEFVREKGPRASHVGCCIHSFVFEELFEEDNMHETNDFATPLIPKLMFQILGFVLATASVVAAGDLLRGLGSSTTSFPNGQTLVTSSSVSQ